ncbi:MAG: hypothetical protein ACR2M9_05160, partial [Cyanophyceae cyanobacterium]
VGQLLNLIPAAAANGGSYIQYQRIDLDYMARNNEVMMPAEVSSQRTSPVPLGYSSNGNNFDQIEEFIFILSRPLNNTNLEGLTNTGLYEDLRNLGLDGTTGSGTISGNAGWPTQAQTIYAEKRMYSWNDNLGATVNNGELYSPTRVPPPAIPYNTLFGMPVLDNVSSWGSMSAITGPNLHCYRVIINRSQSFPGVADLFVNVDFTGETSMNWPACNIRFLCKDPNFTEGEYLTRIANAMNSIAEGGPTA